MSKISVIIPMKNESCGINLLFERLIGVLNNIDADFEIIVVNDGSNDDTLELLLNKKINIPELKIVDLSRNFGKESALYAGFYHASGDCAVAIDADLQHPPELIEEMFNHWLDGYEVVTAVRSSRKADTFLKRKSSGLFYKIINKISEINITPHSGDFRLLDRKAINAFLELKEVIRFNKGIFTWIGFKEKLVYHELSDRAVGQTKWNYYKLIKFSIDGITSFSKAPLEVWTYLGLSLFFVSFLSMVYYLVKTLLLGNSVPGYPSLFILILFFGGVQLLSIGVLGKYIGRIFMEVKRRPLYIERKFYD